MTDAFGDRGALRFQRSGRVVGVERCAHGVGEADGDFGVEVFQAQTGAGQGAACADGANEAIDISVRVFPDFACGCGAVAFAIGSIVELIGPHGAVRFGQREFFSETAREFDVIIGVGIGNCRDFDQFGADLPEHILFFNRLSFWDDNDRSQAERIADEGEADAGISGSALDDDAAFPDETLIHGVTNDRKSGAVLDRAAGVHKFRLAENRAPGEFGGGFQTDERGATNCGEDIGFICHGASCKTHREKWFVNRRESGLLISTHSASVSCDPFGC